MGRSSTGWLLQSLRLIFQERSIHRERSIYQILCSIKSDVYALGMVFLEAVGVSMITLMRIKSGKININHDNSVLGELTHLVLQAVNQGPLKRLAPKELHEKFMAQLGRVSDSNFTRMILCRKWKK